MCNPQSMKAKFSDYNKVMGYSILIKKRIIVYVFPI